MGDLKIIVVVVAGIKGFVQMIICHGMKSSLIDPSRIIPMNDLAHKPKIWFYFLCHMAECFHIFEIQNVSGVQADPVDIKFFHPEADHVANVIANRRIVLVQLCEKVITAPVLV